MKNIILSCKYPKKDVFQQCFAFRNNTDFRCKYPKKDVFQQYDSYKILITNMSKSVERLKNGTEMYFTVINYSFFNPTFLRIHHFH